MDKIKQKTAVETLIEQLDGTLVKSIFERLEREELFTKALQLEKDWMIHTYWEAYKEGRFSGDRTAEEYYNETFNI